jgi:hypothetical protein
MRSDKSARLQGLRRNWSVVLISAGVVVLMGLGTAIAHHGLITSSEIKNRTIRAVDQKSESTNSRVIRNNSVGRRDIANATENYFVVPPQVPSGKTIRGAIGGDFHVYSEASDDFGVIASLPIPASSGLSDDDVHVVVSTWSSGNGQSQPTTSDGNAGCTGTLATPTAPRGDVCIYVAGGDNAENLSGYSVRPGTGASRYGFKLKWDAAVNGDTFIDAVWAYRAD